MYPFMVCFQFPCHLVNKQVYSFDLFSSLPEITIAIGKYIPEVQDSLRFCGFLDPIRSGQGCKPASKEAEYRMVLDEKINSMNQAIYPLKVIDITFDFRQVPLVSVNFSNTQ
jgi:hypothetical protein